MKTRSAAGFAVVDLLFVCAIIGILAGMATPGLLNAKNNARGVSAVGSLRMIAASEITYALTCGSGFYSPDLTTLGIPAAGSTDPFLAPDLTSANTVSKSGYMITVSGTAVATTPPTCNGVPAGTTSQGFVATADPQNPGANSRYFGVNVNAVIYEDTASFTGVMTETNIPPSGRPIH